MEPLIYVAVGILGAVVVAWRWGSIGAVVFVGLARVLARRTVRA